MNTTGKRIIQRTLAILVIFIMTMADWSIIGINLISYAVGDSEVNNENIAFSAYFDSESKTKEMTKTIDASDLKLIIELNVKNDGYLTGAKLELGENANFKFKTNLVDSHIKKIEENTIYLNQINEGDELKLQVGIEFAYKEQMPIDYFSKESEINLTGSYINSKNVSNNQGQEIKGKANVKINWQSNQNTNSKLEAELLTNSTYKIEEANKKVVQVLIKSNIENNSYPVKNTNIKVNLAREPESVEVHARTLDATNGSKEFTKGYADKVLTINASNNKDNKIIWKKGVQDEYIVTLIYPENTEITNQTISVASTLTTYDEKVLEKQAQVVINKEIDGIATVIQKEETDQISKGKIYAGEDKAYKTKTQLNIDYAKAIEQIVLEEQTPKFIKQNEEKQANVQYKKTTIDKNEFLEIFGEEGTIQILDQEENEAETITKETRANEQGKITIEYTPGTTSLKITTSKPITEGVLTLEHEKEILETEYTRAELQQITKIKDKNKITYTKTDSNKSTAKSEATLNLKETESQVTFIMDKQTLVDSQEQELNMQVTLLANNENRDLYKNPEIKITMPQQIKIKSAKIKALYLNNLDLEQGNFKVEKENNNYVIKTKLTGEQKSYPGEAILGTQIQINATLELNKLEEDVTEKIKLTYTNENATTYADNGKHEQNIKLLAHQKAQETETPTEETQQIKLDLEAKVGETTIKQGETVRSGEIITYIVSLTNNGKSKASNIKLNVTIPEATTLLEINPDYADGEMNEQAEEKVYFLEKSSKQINKENISIEAGKTINYEYMVRVNNELTENKEIEAKATINAQGKEKTATIKHKTEQSKLVATLTPIQRQTTEKLIAGYSALYMLEIYNQTDIEQKNVQVTINKSNIIQISELAYYLQDEYKEIDSTNSTFTIPSIPAKSSVKLHIDSIIKQNIEDGSMAEIHATVKGSDEITYRSNRLTESTTEYKVEASLTSSAKNKNKKIEAGELVKYTLKIKNTGKQNIENLTIHDRFSDYLELQKLTLNGKTCEYEEQAEFGGEGEDGETIEDINYNTLIIETPLKASEEIIIEITGKVPEDIMTADILKIINKAYIYNTILLAETDEITYYIAPADIEDPENPNYNGNNGNGNVNGNGQSSNSGSGYTISGTAWLDSNNNGARESEETLLEGIRVYAVDVSSNLIATNTEGIQTEVTTDSEGKYVLQNLPKGEYIVAFEYDTERYEVTKYQADGISSNKNSDAVKASKMINNEEKTLAITDSISLEANTSNIDLGLKEAKIFDLDLEKVVSKMIVTNKEGTKTYNFEDTNLAKTEIRAKNLNGSNVVIEYKMKVTNHGEIPGYAKTIVDYVPSSLKYNSSINKEWYQKGNYLYSDSLANTIIEPGETKEITLTLTKVMTESNTGLTNNRAEIAEYYNNLGVQDVDILTDEQKETKDEQNISSADILITPSTGAAVSYVALTLTTLIIIGGAAYLINKKILIQKIKI